MNPIKKFFAKRKSERNFNQAGPGHRLADNARPTNSRENKQDNRQPVVPHHRLSEGVKKAGAAALARFEQNRPTDVNWSLAALRAQARKELELEQARKELELEQARKELKLEARNSPKAIASDSAPVLSVSGVYFSSPFTGPAILPRSEIEAKIKEFLYEQLEMEQGLSACLIIHTCNKDKEKVRLGMETICRYLTNIIQNPAEEKYKKIRVNNRVFQERVACLEGAYDFLFAAGFKSQSLTLGDVEEEYFVFSEEKLENTEDLQMLKEALLTAEPVCPVLDRNIRVLMPSQACEKINLPSDFFNLTPEELIKEYEARVDAVEMETQLRTKAMRERDYIKELRTYRYSLVRVRLPDGIILQGTFNVRERLFAVKEFIAKNIADPDREFLLLAPGGFKLTEYDSTLAELKLAPAVIINLQWADDDEKPGYEVAYLKPETMALLQAL